MESNQRKFVYVVLAQSKKSNYISNGQADERNEFGGYRIYGIYKDNHAAIDAVHNIYDLQILGVKHDTEYFVVKKQVYN